MMAAMSMTATAASTSRSSEAPTRTSAVRPPLGVTSNFDDPPDAGHDFAFFVTIISTVLIFSLFLVRGYAKFAILRQVTPEDGRSCNHLTGHTMSERSAPADQTFASDLFDLNRVYRSDAREQSKGWSVLTEPRRFLWRHFWQ